MAYGQGEGQNDYEYYVHFAESRDLDPDNEALQEAYFTFIFEYDGIATHSNPDSIEALFDFLDAIEYDYDEADIYERYVGD